MTKQLRIPFLVDLVRTDDPAHIRALGRHEGLDRSFTGKGPLLNRILTRKVRTVIALDGEPLPSVAPRGDPQRARKQAELQSELDALARALDDDSIMAVAKAVRGHGDAPRLELAVQQAVGRLFAASYRATPKSWAAAQLLDHAAHSMNPLASLFWRLTGKITGAQHLLAAKVHNDRAGVHATGIAIHNLVRGFADMRAMFAPGAQKTDQAPARCLRAPESVLREATAESTLAGCPVQPGTLVVLDLKAAQQRDGAGEIVFMSGSWSQCPASTWVPEFIRAVWLQAQALPAPQPESLAATLRLAPARLEAAQRRAVYRGILGCSLIVQFMLGLAMVAAPQWLADWIAVPGAATGLVRIWGLMLLILVALYGAGWLEPVFMRWPNVVGILGRYASALLYLCLGGALLWFALLDAVFATALAWAYAQALRAELMTRP